MEINSLIEQLNTIDWQEGLAIIGKTIGTDAVFTTSLGKEDQVVLHTLHQQNLAIETYTLDTGRLFPESYDLLAQTNARYGNRIQVAFPNSKEITQLVAEQGINGFYATIESRKSCCHVRKIAPLKKVLANKKVWITGLRATQSENRKGFEKASWDTQFNVLKYNPLIDFTSEEIESLITLFAIPVNALHAKGFASIGCAPCTRAIEPHEDERAGRWWWENSHKECGLHATLTSIQNA